MENQKSTLDARQQAMPAEIDFTKLSPDEAKSMIQKLPEEKRDQIIPKLSPDQLIAVISLIPLDKKSYKNIGALPVDTLKKVLPNFTVEQLILVFQNTSGEQIEQWAFTTLPPEKSKAFMLANDERIVQKEANNLQKQLALLEQNKALEEQISKLEMNIEWRERNIRTLRSQKVAFDLWSDYNESLNAMITAEQDLISELERTKKENEKLINNPNYTEPIHPNYEVYASHMDWVNKKLESLDKYTENGKKVAETVHGAMRESAKMIVAFETWGNPLAIAATAAVFDGMKWWAEYMSGDKTGSEVLTHLWTWVVADLAAGYFAKIPWLKKFEHTLKEKYWKKVAEYVAMQIGSALIRTGVHTTSKQVAFQEVWEEVEKTLPKDTTTEEKNEKKALLASEMHADLMSAAVLLGVELIPEGTVVRDVLLHWAARSVVENNKPHHHADHGEHWEHWEHNDQGEHEEHWDNT